ncbi:MAG: response regulator [Halomonadaceae bacterium]|nr:MAG: response regulator [Halomonadaceae bacterium]
MRRWGIRKKVLVLALAPAMGLLLLMGLFFTQSWISNLNQLLQDRGQSLSRQAAAAAEYGAFTGNRSLLLSVASALLQEQDVRSITLYDIDQRELVHTGPRNPLARDILPGGQSLNSNVQPGVFRGEGSSLFLAPIKMQDLMLEGLPGEDPLAPEQPQSALGWAVVELSHDNLEKERYRVLLVSLGLISGGFLINCLIALRLSRSVTDPIYELTRATARLREGKLDTRVYTDAGPELEQLESGMNAMARALSKAHSEMQQNVEQATEDLRETLETIEIQNIELDLARKQALEASRIKSEFLANMSHEIRTPLNGIIGFTELLLKTPASRQQQDHLDTIRKSSEILLTIINDILDFSKIEAGKLILDRVPFTLRDIIEDVLVMLAPAAHEKNLDLVSMVYDDVPNDVMGDPLRVKQVITNLVNNAIKFTQTGEVVVRAMLADDDDQEATASPASPLVIRLSVTDTGVGLSRAQQQSLFNAFNQADASTARQYGGTGLGLVISRRLVEEMGGEIGLESELGRGSSFWFTLVTEESTQPSEAPDRSGLKEEPVLYLESQAATGLAMEHLLSWWGLSVERVNSTAEMLDRVQQAQSRQQGYSVAIVGISRHLLRSAQYRELIYQLEFDCDCRVLLLTPTLHEGQDTIVHMASDHLDKPLRRDRLYRALFRLVHGSYPEEPDLNQPLIAPRDPDFERPPRILAVDDNAANLKLLVTLLQDLQLPVDSAVSGYQAINQLQQETYDLVFMDVQMPGMDGIEATKRIRQLDNANRQVAVIALTAHALAEEQEKLLACGFDGYLTKPIDQTLIQDTIGRRTGYHFPELLPPAPRGYIAEKPTVRPSKRNQRPPTVDIQGALKLTGGRGDLAEEMLEMLLGQLDEDRAEIHRALAAEDQQALLERVHRLHGACRYCGVPALRYCAEALEISLKRQQGDISERLDDLLAAMTTLQQWAEDTPWRQQIRQPS